MSQSSEQVVSDKLRQNAKDRLLAIFNGAFMWIPENEISDFVDAVIAVAVQEVSIKIDKVKNETNRN